MLPPSRPLLLLLWAVVTWETSRADHLSSHAQELWNNHQHVNYILSFPCQKPQPRVLPIPLLFPPEETRGKAYFPDVTVLFRCDSLAGCCSPGHRCAPEKSDTVNLPFKVTFLEDIEYHRTGSWIMEYHLLDNHTECACTPDTTDTHLPPHRTGRSAGTPTPSPDTPKPPPVHPTTRPPPLFRRESRYNSRDRG